LNSHHPNKGAIRDGNAPAYSTLATLLALIASIPNKIKGSDKSKQKRFVHIDSSVREL
jgi:starvation-inducible outer membrane lipoprotein